MSRSRLLLVAASLAAGVVGCAHCDTCDDFPQPCIGAGCGYNSPVVPTYAAGPGVVAGDPGGFAPMPAPSGPIAAPVTASPYAPTPVVSKPAKPPAGASTEALPRDQKLPGETTTPPDPGLPGLPGLP